VGLIWLAIVAVLLAVIGAYYYLRVVKLMYFDAAEDQTPIAPAGDLRVLITVNALALVAVMPWVGTLIALCQQAIKTLA
jgi:NADH-quinone oxidoreductase subunit N